MMNVTNTTAATATSRRSPRYRVVADRDNQATYVGDNGFGEQVEWAFFAPIGGGYVRQRTSDGRNPQVCDGLASTGNTLRWDGREPLAALIRREARKMWRDIETW